MFPKSKWVFVEGLSGGRLGAGMRGSHGRLSHDMGTYNISMVAD
jgi:hypothetical protein